MSAQLASLWPDLLLAAVFPVLLFSLWEGPSRYESPAIQRHFDAQKYLRITSDVFLVMLALSSIAKLGFHFGYLPAAWKPSTMMVLGAIVGTLAFASIFQHVAAFIKARRAARQG